MIEVAVGGDHAVEAGVEQGGMDAVTRDVGCGLRRQGNIGQAFAAAAAARCQAPELFAIVEPEPVAVGIEPFAAEGLVAAAADRVEVIGQRWHRAGRRGNSDAGQVAPVGVGDPAVGKAQATAIGPVTTGEPAGVRLVV